MRISAHLSILCALFRFYTWIRNERVGKGQLAIWQTGISITVLVFVCRGKDVNVPEIVANWDPLMKRHLGQKHINMHMGTSTKGTKLPDSLPLPCFLHFHREWPRSWELADCVLRCEFVLTNEQTFLYIVRWIKFLHYSDNIPFNSF